ncbi:MAG TPA: hypothetical protein VKW76_05345 [Candidatus Binatia bacterium]|nr:hypothetical protein [Candidatus Binatia bacterium]
MSTASSLVEAARLMTGLALPSIPVFERDAVVGTLAYRDVLRGLRRARPGLGVAAIMTPDPVTSAADAKPSDGTLGAAGGTEERTSALFEPDVLLPSQYVDRLRRSAEYDPERRLMVAVLEQGVNDYLKYAGAREPEGLELWREVEAWVDDRDAQWFFSFENICHVLDIEPDYLRRGLSAYTERVRRGAREEPPSAAAPGAPPERARATSG